MKTDINCDMGESFGSYRIGRDEEVMPFITSANVACGWHAGDPMIMERTLVLAKKLGFGVGAHLPVVAGHEAVVPVLSHRAESRLAGGLGFGETGAALGAPDRCSRQLLGKPEGQPLV